ncbi:histidine kinase [Marichromatium purpuratum 984]|uniref:histidine kinase n=1 Tax=Marichromatium purpuratum 984 TaxID=765910 RepID=W0E4I6_MARPU|nr:response regulator [Marichromatium purpuratum]AHF04124.1 histidine kinase [Marichromatium purpuratum 984]
MNVRTRFAGGLIAILIVDLAVGLYGFHLHKQAADRESEIRARSSQIVTTALTAQVSFKTQVQEWKNILLRGQDPDLYQRYLAQFEQEETETRAAVARLLELLREHDPRVRASAERFLAAHLRLGTAYRAALDHYRAEDPAAQLIVDRDVRGIDREPTELIDRLVAEARTHERIQIAAIDHQTRVAEFQVLALVLGVMSVAVAALIWLLDRTIGQPIATATAIARRVSAGDFSTQIQVSGNDEHAQMLHALKHMQENLANSQEHLRQSEARFRLLLESTGEGIYGVDTQGRCTFCNPAGARMLGYDAPQALHGRDMHQTLHHSHLDASPYAACDCRAARTHRDGTPARVDDEVFWRADGTSIPVEYHANPIYRDGSLVGAVVTFADISARKRAEQALRNAHQALAEERALLAERVLERTAELDRANVELARSARAKDEFLAAMSHELRTPLTSILGLSETIGDTLLGPLTAQQARAVHTIHENGAHLLELINDILDMSRVASGQMQLRWDQIPVNQLWEASLRLIGPAAKRKSITIATDIDPAVRLVQGDSRRLKQMLVNLLGNAVKFTPEGGRIGLEVRADATQGEVHVCVWDTGVGIAPEQRERLFQPFVQLDSRPSRQYDGSGLGLALAAGMAELHHGRIEVESEPGAGSRFDIVLPWDPAAQEAGDQPGAHAASDDETAEADALGQVQVLLVEDNESNQEMIATYLRIRGCAVATARSGKAALAQARAHRPDVILMDVQIPGMDGLETTRRLREAPALRRTPIIALTALAMPGDREQCLDAGMDDYLSKPLGLKELYNTLTGWVRRTRES